MSTAVSVGSGTRGPTPVFVDDVRLEIFGKEHIVNVDDPWSALLVHIATNNFALIRAPPKSGKTMLGKLASDGRVAAVDKGGYEVRYCSDISKYAIFVKNQGFTNVEDMAKFSEASAKDSTRKTVVYFFDEAHEIPGDIYQAIIKDICGYAVFASTNAAVCSDSYATPAELRKNSFFYKLPASSEVITTWLAGRLAALFSLPAKDTEVQMAADLLWHLSGGHIGIIQYLGCKLEKDGCKNLRAVRSYILTTLKFHQNEFFDARCFGVGNGAPEKQGEILSMLRCSGGLEFVNELGHLKRAWSEKDPVHRRGLSNGFYAPAVSLSKPLVPVGADIQFRFTHALQPEVFNTKFTLDPEWEKLSHSHRWVVNFSHNDMEEAAKLPTHVVDLVVSWLSNIATADLVYAADRADAREDVFQRSLDEFRMWLGVEGRREATVKTGHLHGQLDLLLNGTFGIELLIRAARSNKYTATKLLQEGSTTWTSLLEHASRTDAAYAEVASRCRNGYITVLPATLTSTTVEQEWTNFRAFITKLQENAAPALKYHIMVAVARSGWSEFSVFLHQPGQQAPIRFEIPRQRLLFKVVDGQPQSARHFYPRPEKVWVQEINESGEAVDEPFQVEPQEDSVQSLRTAILLYTGIKSRRQLRIHQLNHAGEWEVIPKKSQVLFANTEEKPYGFYVKE